MQLGVGHRGSNYTGDHYKTMRTHTLIFLLGLLPLGAMAQAPAQELDPSSSTAQDGERVNATTLALLRANCPKDMAEADWLRLMAKPVNRSLYPLRITQAMLDTLDASKLDPGYQYVLVQ